MKRLFIIMVTGLALVPGLRAQQIGNKGYQGDGTEKSSTVREEMRAQQTCNEGAKPGKDRSVGDGMQAEHNTREEMMVDIERAGGVHYMYPEDQPRPTAAPKGYKPFYISHLGRHGARYALGASVYADLLGIWTKGHENGWLTPEGEALYKAYAEWYPQVARREGNLTLQGQEQHRRIARQMYRDYPAVFKGNTCAVAVSTGVHRVIVSMFSCLGEMDQLDRSFSYSADYGYPYQACLLPDAIDAHADMPDSVVVKCRRFLADRVDVGAILGRWFTRTEGLVNQPYAFCADLHTVVSTLDNLDFPAPAVLQEAFSPGERYRLWEVNNYMSYLRLGLSPEVENVRPRAMEALLRDLLDTAEDDWARGIDLRLRFAHDSTLLPLLSLMDVNGMGYRGTDPLEVENHWRTFDVPMAANLQLVFFRSRRSPELLVQVLLNGREATLPIAMAAPGSFYRWDDIKAYYAPRQ